MEESTLRWPTDKEREEMVSYHALTWNIFTFLVVTVLFGMRHLTYGTNFLHLFAFLVSRPPQLGR